MAVEIEPGYKVNGEVSLSPLVVLGPHTGQELSSSYELSIPLEITRREDVRVLISHTSCFELPRWEELPPAQFTVHDNHVIISATNFTRIQGQCGGQMVVTPLGELIYFSVSTHRRPTLRILKLLCSSRVQECIEGLQPFELAHEPVDCKDNGIYLSPGEGIDISIEAKDESIIQTSSPQSKLSLREPLKEEFYLKSESLINCVFRWGKLREKLVWTWTIVPRDGNVAPTGALYAQCINSSIVEGRARKRTAEAAGAEEPSQAEASDRAIKTTHFGFVWKDEEKVSGQCRPVAELDILPCVKAAGRETRRPKKQLLKLGVLLEMVRKIVSLNVFLSP